MTKSRNLRPPYRIWSQADLAYLREHYADTPTAELARALGTDVRRVYAAANRHGLAKSHTFLMTAASRSVTR